MRDSRRQIRRPRPSAWTRASTLLLAWLATLGCESMLHNGMPTAFNQELATFGDLRTGPGFCLRQLCKRSGKIDFG